MVSSFNNAYLTPALICPGERVRIYKCCARPVSEGEGCQRGPHVFYESQPEQLHSRHAFAFTRPPTDGDQATGSDTALDVVALDCEMIYTTAGMSVARVSVVDGAGARAARSSDNSLHILVLGQRKAQGELVIHN